VEPRWLVVGLGNPGPQYEWTPHNLGFLVVDKLAQRGNIRLGAPRGVPALAGEGVLAGQPVVLAKPLTYMNRSGLAVKELAQRYGVDGARTIVIVDDLDLPWQMIRVRPRGSAGGHRGLQSVIDALGTQEFLRVRVGIHPGYPVEDAATYVLDRFPKAFEADLDDVIERAAAAVECILAEGVDQAMARFNRRAQGVTREDP